MNCQKPLSRKWVELDFFFHPSIFIQLLSGRPFGLDSPISDCGGLCGGVKGSLLELSILPESSVSASESALVLDVLLRPRVFLPLLDPGVSRPVGSAGWTDSELDMGDPLRFDLFLLILIVLESLELSEPHLFLLEPSTVAFFPCRTFIALLFGGASFRKGIRTDSSIKLYIILTAASRVVGLGGVDLFGNDSKVSRTSLGMLISLGQSGIMYASSIFCHSILKCLVSSKSVGGGFPPACFLTNSYFSLYLSASKVNSRFSRQWF